MGRYKAFYWGEWKDRYTLTGESQLDLIWAIFQKVCAMAQTNKTMWVAEKKAIWERRGLLDTGWKIRGRLSMGGNVMFLTYNGSCVSCEIMRQLLAPYVFDKLIMSYRGVSE